MATVLTPRERALLDHAKAAAPRYRTSSAYAGFLRGFYRRGDSEGLKAALLDLLCDHEVFYS